MRSSAAAQRTERRAMESLNSRVVMALILLLLLACINYAKSQESRKYTDEKITDLSQKTNLFLSTLYRMHVSIPGAATTGHHL